MSIQPAPTILDRYIKQGNYRSVPETENRKEHRFIDENGIHQCVVFTLSDINDGYITDIYYQYEGYTPPGIHDSFSSERYKIYNKSYPIVHNTPLHSIFWPNKSILLFDILEKFIDKECY